MFRHGQPIGIVATVLLAVAAPAAGRAASYTPESPEVRQMVEKGVAFLGSSACRDDRFGAKPLAALALIMAEAPRDHPKVVDAIEDVRSLAASEEPARESNCIYGLGLSTVLLLAFDHDRYRSEIERLLAALAKVQKPHGGWGYLPQTTGDTSMTQYPVLAMWEASHVGIYVPPQMAEGALTWLLKTQDPSGGFGYQGNVSPDFNPISQSEVRLSLSTAGLGSLYVCSDLAGLRDRRPQNDDVPSALKEKQDAAEIRRPLLNLPDEIVRVTRDAKARGNTYLRYNYRIDPPEWTYYYLYALERYWSFREKAEGAPPYGSPDWYGDGVRFLMKNQRADGSWQGSAGQLASTSFAVLFLVRSTQKSIQEGRDFGAGTMVGGQGLPSDTDVVVVRGGTVVSAAENLAFDRAIWAIRNEGGIAELENLEALAAMPPDRAAPLIDQNAEALRKLAGSRAPEARLAAVRALAKRRSMDDVPVLIYALSDPDARVVLEARDALRRISRKFNGFGLSDTFTDPQRSTAIKRWKAWFRSVRPDAEFTR